MQRQSVSNVMSSLNGLSASQAVSKLNTLGLNPNLSKEILSAAQANNRLTSSFEETQKAMTLLNSSATNNVNNSFTKLLSTVKTLAPAIGIATLAIGAFAAYQWADDKFTLSLESAQKHAQESAKAYNQTSSELSNLNSKLSETQTRIDELRSKDSLSLIEQQELSKLEQQNSLLKAQSQVKQNMAQQQAKKTAEDTKTALNFDSETIYKRDKNGNLQADSMGNIETEQVDRFEYIDSQIEALNKAEENLKNAEEKLFSEDSKNLSDKQQEQLTKNYESCKKTVEKYKSDILSMTNEMNQEADAGFYLSDGSIVSGYEDEVQKITDLNDKVAQSTGNLSSVEKQSLADILKKDDLAQAQQLIVNALRSGADISVDTITSQFPALAERTYGRNSRFRYGAGDSNRTVG